MNLRVFFIVLSTLISYSCSRSNGNGVAERICNCYDQIHYEQARIDDSNEIDKMVESCNKMYKEALLQTQNDKAKKEAFIKAFRACQDK